MEGGGKGGDPGQTQGQKGEIQGVEIATGELEISSDVVKVGMAVDDHGRKRSETGNVAFQIVEAHHGIEQNGGRRTHHQGAKIIPAVSDVEKAGSDLLMKKRHKIPPA